MNQTLKRCVQDFGMGLLLTMMAGGGAYAEEAKSPGETGMTLHHLHMSMLDHGLGMAAEGSNLLMLSEMGMAAEFNPTTRAHGQAMLKRGKALIERALSGEEMKGLHEKAGTEGAMMRQTHELAEAGKKVIDLLEKMHV